MEMWTKHKIMFETTIKIKLIIIDIKLHISYSSVHTTMWLINNLFTRYYTWSILEPSRVMRFVLQYAFFWNNENYLYPDAM